jgi:single-strand DNA-binding protein
MAGSVNKVILVGNLGKDPEVRRLENGATVANFSIATSESYTDKSTGERIEQTDWHNIVVWRGLAEIAEKYVKKGTKVYVCGRLKNRTWTDQNGVTKYSTEILADELTILSAKQDSQNTTPNNPPYPTENQPGMNPMDIDNNSEEILPF